MACWSLAGQRADIIDFDRHEMWEIKPAGVASRALLQVFSYLDNYEVARVVQHYIGATPPPLAPGSPATLPGRVLKPFELEITQEVSLAVAPYVVPDLPGLILYTVRVRTRRQPEPAAARRAFAVTSLDVEQALVAARRDMQQLIEIRDAETRRLLVYAALFVICLGVAVAAAAVAAAAEAAAVGVAASGAAAAGTAAGTTAAEGLAGEVTYLAAVRAAPATIETITAVAPRIAASVTVYFAGQQFVLPPETPGLCIGGGCELGDAATPPNP
jgi:hypothetical protein